MLLQQLSDCYHSLSLFDNHIEFIDEVVEDYNFDAYLGVMSKGDDKTYGIENMQRAASPLLHIMDILDEGDKLMESILWLSKTLSDLSLQDCLLKDKKLFISLGMTYP